MIKNLNNTPKEAKDSRGGSSYSQAMPFSVACYNKVRQAYQIQIFGPIEETEQFSDALMAFNLANEDDEVTILLCSPGGNVLATQTFISEMQRCKAHVHVKASGECASCSAMILASSETFEVDPNITILFHTVKTGTWGCLQDSIEDIEFQKKVLDRWMKQTLAGLFSAEELDSIIVGKKEFLMTADEFLDRSDLRAAVYDVIAEMVQNGEVDPEEFDADLFFKLCSDIRQDILDNIDEEPEEDSSEKEPPTPKKAQPKKKPAKKDSCCGKCKE